MKWFYALNNQKIGPISDNEFDFLVHQNKIRPDTLVWNETMAGWKPLREVMPPEPTAFVPPPPPLPSRNGPAWEERDQIGGIKAAVFTVMELLRSPSEGFARMKQESDFIGPYCFALFAAGSIIFAMMVYHVLQLRAGAASLPWPGVLFVSNYVCWLFIITSYFSTPVLISLIILFFSALIHVCLGLAGGSSRPFVTTFRVVCYSVGASAVLLIIPMAGLFIAMAFYLVLTANGIARMHEVPTGKAILALTPVTALTVFLLLHILGAF
ncbi:MAG TPA: GYF domain-containing protein [Chthoniobacteraceae bacterium]|nr:GYF domain-containing protein [Chthoniobacteraceae bacterium]